MTKEVLPPPPGYIVSPKSEYPSCRNCKHRRDNFVYPDLCTHDLAQKAKDLVDGKVMFTYCKDMRDNDGMCEPEGLLFEERKSIFKRIFC